MHVCMYVCMSLSLYIYNIEREIDRSTIIYNIVCIYIYMPFVLGYSFLFRSYFGVLCMCFIVVIFNLFYLGRGEGFQK